MCETLLPWTFSILKFCGFWRPRNLDSQNSWATRGYDVFTALMALMVLSFSFCGLVDVALTAGNVEDLTGNVFILLTLINALCKGINVLFRRKDIVAVEETLLGDVCRPRNVVEISIQNQFNRMAKSTTTYYMMLIEISVCLVTVRSLYDLQRSAVLPFRMWLPYDYSSSAILLWGTYIYETVTNLACSLLHVASESLVSGLMIQVCAQLEILKYRLQQVPRQSSRTTPRQGLQHPKNTVKLADCIYHHNLIFEFAEASNRIFKPILVIQFIVSSVVICSSVYLLAGMSVASVQFVSLLSYVISILVQLFLYCWYGNEVILKSLDISDAAYEMDWTTLDIRGRRILVTMMIRSMSPIKFTSSFLVTLSIDSYMSIVKLSYSAFNVLQQSSMS